MKTKQPYHRKINSITIFNIFNTRFKDDVYFESNKRFSLTHKKSIFTHLKNERPTRCHLLFYFTSYVLNMSRTLIYPSSGACDCVVELPHRSSFSQFVVCWRFGAADFEWCSFCSFWIRTQETIVRLDKKLFKKCQQEYIYIYKIKYIYIY